MENILTTQEARKKFTEIINETFYGKKCTILTKKDIPVARICPIESYQKQEMEQWISIKEKEPLNNQLCLYVGNNENKLFILGLGLWQDIEGIKVIQEIPKNCGCSDIKIEEVIFWMPIPFFETSIYDF